MPHYQAIAEVTGVPVGTVRSRLNRARARLGTALLHTAEGAAPSQASLEATRRGVGALLRRAARGPGTAHLPGHVRRRRGGQRHDRPVEGYRRIVGL
ncbi:MAG TPA: sigma factor-like helix-turn-helix DNA-binding protein [Streptosporangiaceae bacterium]|nr:sigma factor-like helix-turn-helix DNA-binding protein [Streptosporangiaceae bacterium]